jgi:hypothetical protein
MSLQLTEFKLSNSDDVSIRTPPFFFPTGQRPQPFTVDNTVMLTDGLCGSSCASFHEEMKNVAGVKSVVVGGRPNETPMQVVGGTKGGEVIPLQTVVAAGAQIINATDSIGATSLDGSVINDLANVTQVLVRTAAAPDSSRIQTQDQIRKGDKSGTPLQYIYEAADCRIWNTAATLFDPNEAWKATWVAAWGNKDTCVTGSTGDKSSISGGYKPFGPGPVCEG